MVYKRLIEKAEKNLVPIKPKRSFQRKEYSGRNKYKANLRNNMRNSKLVENIGGKGELLSKNETVSVFIVPEILP